jgi:hypothetical protein
MSIFQLVVVITAIVFVLFGIDLYKRKKMNALHFIVFIGWGILVAIFAIDVNLLNKFWSFFGAARGADVVVIGALIFLMYLYIDGVNRQTKDKMELTRLITSMAIKEWLEKYKHAIINYQNKTPEDNYIFHCRVYNESRTLWLSIDEIINAW